MLICEPWKTIEAVRLIGLWVAYGGDANKDQTPAINCLNEMELYNTVSTNSYLNEK